MKKIAIIGAGIAGLASGILAQENGFETEIFEMHTLPGGLCTGWKRGGYTFDGCIRYVYGSGEGKMLHSLMRRIGTAGTQKYTQHEESIRVETSTGKTVVFHCDLDKLQEHLLEIGPEDEKPIRKLIHSAKSLSKATLPTGNPERFGDLVKAMLYFIPHVVRNGKKSLEGFASGLKSADLREAFEHYYGYADLRNLPLFYLIMDMAQHHVRNAGWPSGGSLALAKAMERKYVSSGGKINYGSRVEKVLVNGGKAAGVRLADGKECPADYVISAADAHATLESMLGGEFTPREYKDAFASAEKPITPLVQVSLGVAMDFTGVPHNQSVILNEPILVAGISYDRLSFKHYCYDCSMSPTGKSAVVAVLETDYGAWVKLAEDKTRYKAEKDNATEQVIARLDERFPGLAGNVEACDVATPLTWERYTGNFEGSPQGWQTTLGHVGNLPDRLPGLQGFYMTGQWVQRGGGIPGGAVSAYNTIKKLCKDTEKRFK